MEHLKHRITEGVTIVNQEKEKMGMGWNLIALWYLLCDKPSAYRNILNRNLTFMFVFVIQLLINIILSKFKILAIIYRQPVFYFVIYLWIVFINILNFLILVKALKTDEKTEKTCEFQVEHTKS